MLKESGKQLQYIKLESKEEEAKSKVQHKLLVFFTVGYILFPKCKMLHNI